MRTKTVTNQAHPLFLRFRAESSALDCLFFFFFYHCTRTPLAHGQIDEEENVELHHGSEDEEEPVHDETDGTDPLVEDEAVECGDDVEADHAEDDGEITVYQATRVDDHISAGHGRSDSPG